MPHIPAILRSKAFLWGIAAAALAAAGFLLFLGSRGDGETLFTAMRGPFVQDVSVSGKVTAAQDVDLGFSQGGRVAWVYAKAGDRVVAGAPLAELDNGDLRAAVLQKEAALLREEAKLAALKQGTRPEEIAVAESSVSSDEAALAQANQALLEEIVDAYRSAEDAVHNQVDQFFSNPRTSSPQVTFFVADAQAESDLEFKRLLAEDLLSSWKKDIDGLAVSSDLLAASSRAQGNMNRVAELLAQANAVLNRAVATQTVSQSAINDYVSDVGAARTSLNTAASNLTSAVTAQRDAAASLATSQKNLALKKAGTIQADIDAQAAEVKAAEADLMSARAQLAKTIMFAPFAGVVTKMDLKVGSIASANVSEVSLISVGVFQIESFVPEVHVAPIEPGDKAKVTLDAYGDDVEFSASVVSIDPAETVRDGVSTYRTILVFEKTDPRIRSGMTANVVITTDERDGIVSVPLGFVTEREGTSYVRVKTDEGFAEREVETGAVSSLGFIEIVSGLDEGEIILAP